MNRQKTKLKIIELIENSSNVNETSDMIIDLFVKKRRSVDQNALYWLWLKCIADETGNEENWLHEYFKETYLFRGYFEMGGKMYTCNTSTTRLNTSGFTEYLEKIKIFASSELGIILPLPEDLHFNEFYEKYGI